MSIDNAYPLFPPPRKHKALTNYEPLDGEIELEEGDLIQVINAGNACNDDISSAYGLNERTNEMGCYSLNNVKTLRIY